LEETCGKKTKIEEICGGEKYNGKTTGKVRKYFIVYIVFLNY
jgi:hypothetical protein